MESLKKFFTNEAFLKRLKSFLWRTAGMVTAAGLAFVLAELTAWDPNSMLTVVAGLVIGEITKQLNKK